MKASLPYGVLAGLVLGGLVALPASAKQAQKIGVIEVQRIVQEAAIGKESLARVQRSQAQKQDELGKRQKELRDLEEKLQTQGSTLSDDAKEKLQKDYQQKALDL